MLQTLPGSFRQPLAHDSKRAKEIDRAIATFIAVDMRPFSVVDNVGFRTWYRHLIHLKLVLCNSYSAAENAPHKMGDFSIRYTSNFNLFLYLHGI